MFVNTLRSLKKHLYSEFSEKIFIFLGNIKHLSLENINILNTRELSEITRHLELVQDLSLSKNNLKVSIIDIPLN